MEREMCSYLEWQLNDILRHCTTSKLAFSVISLVLGLIHPWLSLNCYDNFTALCEHGRRLTFLVLVSESSLESGNVYSVRTTRWNERCAPTGVAAQRRSYNFCATPELTSGIQMGRETCSCLEWQLNVDPTKTLVQQPDGTRAVLLAGVAAQRQCRSHNFAQLSNSHPTTR
jgi:hypothetical protein